MFLLIFSSFDNAFNMIDDQCCPTSLMIGTYATSCIAMKIFVEKNEIAKMWIGGIDCFIAIQWSFAVFITCWLYARGDYKGIYTTTQFHTLVSLAFAFADLFCSSSLMNRGDINSTGLIFGLIPRLMRCSLMSVRTFSPAPEILSVSSL